MNNRSFQVQERYERFKKDNVHAQSSFFLDERRMSIVANFEFWYVEENDFPYDNVFSTHHLIVPKRLIAFYRESNQAEHEEFLYVKKKLFGNYDGILENFPGSRSIVNHWHAHLFVWK